MRLLSRVCLLAILSVLPAALHASELYDQNPTQWGDFTITPYPQDLNVYALLRDGKIPEVQAAFERLAQDSARDAEYATHFATALQTLDALVLAAQAEQWLAAFPQSYAAQVALARIRISQAWEARGSGTIDTVKPEDYALFQQRLQEARALLEAAVTQDPAQPEAYVHLITAGMGLQLPIEQRRAWFDAGRKADPSYRPLYDAFLHSIKERWGGGDGEVAYLGHTVVTNPPVHSRVPLVIVDMNIELSETSGQGKAWFAQPRVWKEIDNAYATLETNQQGYLSPFDRTWWTRFALLAGDAKRALEQIEKVGYYAQVAADPYEDSWGYGNWPGMESFLNDRVRLLAGAGQQTTPQAQAQWLVDGLTAAIARVPARQGELLQRRAFAYRAFGRHADALADFDAASKLPGSDPDNFYYLGTLALDQLNDPARAIPAFEQFLQTNPRAYNTQRDLAIAYIRLERNAEALALIQKFMTESPGRSDDLFGLVNNYWERQKFQTGLEQLPVVISLLPTGGRYRGITIQAWRSLSICHETLAQYKEAIAALGKAQELFPNEYVPNLELARLCLTARDPAARDFPRGNIAARRALEATRQPDPKLVYMVAKSYELINQPQQAIQMYQALLQLDPSFTEAQTRINEVQAGRLAKEY